MSPFDSGAAESISVTSQEMMSKSGMTNNLNPLPFQNFRLKAQATFLSRFYQTFWDQIDGKGDTGSPDLSVAESRLLRFLLRNGASRMCDLSVNLGYPTSTLTYMVERLRKRGYIERKRDMTDRRAIRVHLAQKAEGFLQQKNGELVQKSWCCSPLLLQPVIICAEAPSPFSSISVLI